MTNSTPGPSPRAFRGAVALMVLAIIEGVVGLGPKIVNYPIIWATGIQPNVAEGPNVSNADQWAGKMPIVTPWWIFVLIAIAWAVLLFLTRHKSDQYPPRMHGWVRLENTPRYLAFWSIFGALMAIVMSIDSGEPGVGLYWIPAVLLAAVGVVAMLLGRRQKYER